MMSTIVSYYLFIEEFYLGKLVLGKYSGPDDMGLILALVTFYTAYKGSMELWG